MTKLFCASKLQFSLAEHPQVGHVIQLLRRGYVMTEIGNGITRNASHLVKASVQTLGKNYYDVIFIT